MRHKMPYLIIGVLIGIIIMQWNMPIVQGQAYGPVGGTSFLLYDDSGNITGMMFNGSQGPILGLGDQDKPHITIGAVSGLGTGNALLTVTGDEERYIQLGAAADVSLVSIQGQSGKSIQLGTGGAEGDANIFITVSEQGGVSVATAANSANRVDVLASSLGGRIGAFGDETSDGGMVLTGQGNETTGKLPASITGDLNFDGTVDFSDFFLFSDNFGRTVAAKPVLALESPAAKPTVSQWDIEAEYRQKLESLR